MIQKFFTYLLWFVMIFGVFSVEKIFANTTALQCPDFAKMELTADEVVSKIDACLAARANSTTATITDFHCPSGDFTLQDAQSITEDRIAYSVAVNLYMNEVDKKMKVYMQKLADSRDKNPVAWTQEYGACIEWKPQKNEKSLAYFYDNLCGFTFINNFLNSNTKGRNIAVSTEAFPQTECKNLVEKKKKMWTTMGGFLLQNNIAKSYENDRKYFTEAVQGQYRAIIEKFHNYQKIVFRASSKITNYIRNPVQ